MYIYRRVDIFDILIAVLIALIGSLPFSGLQSFVVFIIILNILRLNATRL